MDDDERMCPPYTCVPPPVTTTTTTKAPIVRTTAVQPLTTLPAEGECPDGMDWSSCAYRCDRVIGLTNE